MSSFSTDSNIVNDDEFLINKSNEFTKRGFCTFENLFPIELPYEIQCKILYEFGGLNNPTATIIKKENPGNGLAARSWTWSVSNWKS